MFGVCVPVIQFLQRLSIRQKYLIILIFYISAIHSKGTHNTDNFVDWISGFLRGNFFELYHVIPFKGILPSESLMVPYPPFSLYILGVIAKFITIFVGDSQGALLIASNLTSVIFTFFTAFLLEIRRNTYFSYSPTIYLFTPAVFLISPLLGYQDTIMSFFIVLSIVLLEKKLFFSSGFFAAIAIFSKQLAVMPMFGIGLLILFSFKFKAILKLALGFCTACLLILSPFIITNTLPAYFQAQGLASVHTMMSAQNPNLPWLIALVIRLSKYGFFSEQTYTSLPLRIDSDLIRQVLYLGFGFLTVFTIFSWLVYWKWYKQESEIEPMFIAAIAALAYNLLSFGVHENHVFMALPILFALSATKKMYRVYILTSSALAANLIATGGVGRSFEHFPLLTQKSGLAYSVISAACLALYAVAFVQLLRTAPTYAKSGSPKPSSGLV